MIDQETRRKMRIIGVPEALDIMDAMAADPSYANMGFDERVRVIVDYVAQEKENASVKRLLQRAHFRIANADVSGVVYDGRPLSRDTVNGLGTCQFVESATDVIVVGYTGTGKTFLACSIGRQACKHCLSTLYVRMPDLLMSREEDLAAGIPESKVLKKYARYKVLVVDEWLMDPLNPDQTRFFLELVDRRHDKSSTIWCSQYRVEDWHGRLGGGTHADAIMDRIVHNAVTLQTGEVNMRELMSPRS